MTNVSTFADAKKKAAIKQLKKQVDPAGLFAIPMDDVTQYADSANDGVKDPITMGARAEVAVRRLMAEFGFEELPETLGQLHGLIKYCYFIYTQTRVRPGASVEDTELMARVTDKLMLKNFPKFAAALAAYRDGDMETVRKEHAALGGVAELGRRMNAKGDIELFEQD